MFHKIIVKRNKIQDTSKMNYQTTSNKAVPDDSSIAIVGLYSALLDVRQSQAYIVNLRYNAAFGRMAVYLLHEASGIQPDNFRVWHNHPLYTTWVNAFLQSKFFGSKFCLQSKKYKKYF